MKIGKVPENVLKRTVLKQIHHTREEVLVGAGVGEDCAVAALKEGEVYVLSTDPITGAINEIGKLAIHITANDIAAGGAEPFGVMLTILLPDGTEEAQLRDMMKDMENTCKDLDIQIMGGHTEITKVVTQPVVMVTGMGKAREESLALSRSMKPGQELVMTKWAGLEGTAILASERYDELCGALPYELVDQAKAMIDSISVVKDARVAASLGIHAMHDITEGGVFGALWEVAEASGTGLEVDLRKIPLKQETVEICEYYDLNPYMLISSGCLLMSADRGSLLAETLAKEGIPAAVIGRVTEGNDRIIINGEEKRFLTPPASDELYKII
ncbi:AIR synthase family protein [Anaerolentibacter hominis]|uniref:AIR synthase family protein n=1 Tax=Anaerolentibacter hominis TaxID=3079009 RepID=UPI0031B87F8C